MAGNPQMPDASGGSTAKTATRKLKNFSCPGCGTSVTVRAVGLSLSAICPSCHAVIDTQNEQYKILSTFYQKVKAYTPQIPLGTRGKLKDKTWEMIGFQVRKDVSSGEKWEEYLLFNPYYGYRWLTCYHGHWNYVTMTKERPSIEGFRNESAVLKGKSYRLYNRGTADSIFVLGEFYWKLSAGYRVAGDDYIDPPYMLSMEKDGHEVVWSISEYTEPDEIKKAFNLQHDLVARRTVGANQVSWETQAWKRVRLAWLAFAVILTVQQMWALSMASNTVVLQQGYPFYSNQKSAATITTPVFDLVRDKGNVAIDLNADVDNSWFWVSGEMVNNDTGDTYPFERSVEYYHGWDSDGSWSEGSQQSRVQFSSVPAGKYYINLDTESGDFKVAGYQHQFGIWVRRNVPTYSNYFLCLFLLSLFPGFIWFMSRNAEVNRWSESDYSPYQSSESE